MQINSHQEGDLQIFVLEGKMLGESVSAPLLEAFSNVLDQGIKKFAVDISQLTHSNSIGLGLMVSLNTRVSNQGGKLVYFQPTDSVAKLLRMTRLHQVLTLADSREEALDLLK